MGHKGRSNDYANTGPGPTAAFPGGGANHGNRGGTKDFFRWVGATTAARTRRVRYPQTLVTNAVTGDILHGLVDHFGARDVHPPAAPPAEQPPDKVWVQKMTFRAWGVFRAAGVQPSILQKGGTGSLRQKLNLTGSPWGTPINDGERHNRVSIDRRAPQFDRVEVSLKLATIPDSPI